GIRGGPVLGRIGPGEDRSWGGSVLGRTGPGEHRSWGGPVLGSTGPGEDRVALVASLFKESQDVSVDRHEKQNYKRYPGADNSSYSPSPITMHFIDHCYGPTGLAPART
ncbi:hypothetical protein KUCAC02_029077, partial [Chaenocephalus aceratus]